MRVLKNQKDFQVTLKNNSLVFSWKYPIQWFVISIPPCDYTIEEINEEFNQRINSLMGGNINVSNRVIISVKLQAVSTQTVSIEITSPEIVIDIYQSSIRTVLGFPEHPQIDCLSFLTYGEYTCDVNHKRFSNLEITK